MAESHLSKTDAIVILGASRGIGASVAQHLARSGYQNLLLVARDLAKLEKLKTELLAINPDSNPRVHACNLREENDFIELMHELQSEALFPRHWVLCVGGSPSGKLQREPYESTPWEQVMATIDLNLVVPARVVHQVIPELMRPNADGVVEPSSIIALASQAAHHPVPGMSAYAAAKHGLLGLMRSVADEVRDLNMRFSVISPGMVDTDLLSSHPNLDRSRMIRPEDVARAVLFSLECDPATAPFEVHLRPQRSPWVKPS